MIIKNENKNIINDLYIHDSIFEGYSYDYENRIITFSCDNHYLKKRFKFKFNNVIFSKLQSCCFWGINCCYIYDVKLRENTDDFHQLMNIKNTNPDWFKNSYLDKKDIEYITIEFKLNSGDTILIICENIDLEQEDLILPEPKQCTIEEFKTQLADLGIL